MKNRIVYFWLIVLFLFLLSGCGTKTDKRVEVITSTWRFENTVISIDSDYNFVDFDKVYTEDGKLIITINLDKN